MSRGSKLPGGTGQALEPKDSNRRAWMVGGAGALAFGGLIGRLAQLQLVDGGHFREVANENVIKREIDPPRRGMILDRFGRTLASHRRAGRVSLVREAVTGLDATLARIGEHIPLSEARRDAVRRNAYRQAAFLPTIVAEELSYEDFARLSVLSTEMKGVYVEMAETRSYPRGRDFAHVIGYVARASQRDLERLTGGVEVPETVSELERLFRHPDMRTGRSGLEFFAEAHLRGQPGLKSWEVTADGRREREMPQAPGEQPENGEDVHITIDAELQRDAIERFGAESGAAVVLDLETGDILALVSTPAFDPNDFVNGISQADYDLLRENDRAPLYHKAYDGIYPPGSTFKMVVATAALRHEVIRPHERIYCPGHYRFGNRTWSCWKRGGHGAMDMHSALKQSCDTYFYEVARRVGAERIAETARDFGFGARWDIGITGGATGTVPNDAWKREARGEPWYEGETLNFGIGQGYLTSTPLQLAMMTARIATEGRAVEPRLVGRGPDVPGAAAASAPLSREIMQRMKAGMFGVTSQAGGTAQRSGDLGLGGARMAGKTGTAQVRYISQAERASGVIANEDLERQLRDHALFVGYAPHDDPKYAVAVVVEHGGGGSRAAAPVARDIMAAALRRHSGARPAYQQGILRPATRAALSGQGAP